MSSRWLGLLELFVVFGFVLAYGVVELYTLRLDRRRSAQRAAEEAQRAEPSPHVEAGATDAGSQSRTD